MSFEDRFVLVCVNITQVGFTKKDKEAAGIVSKEMDADRDSYDVIKKLLPTSLIRNLRTEAQKVRNVVYKWTLPFTHDGWRILTIDKYDDFSNEIKESIADLQEFWRVELFDKYDDLVKNAEKRLGKGNRGFEFPSLATIKGRFSANTDMRPVPRGEHFVADIANEEMDLIKAQMESSLMAGYQKAQEELLVRMFKAVKRIIDTLEDPEYTAFHKTMVENIYDLLDDMEQTEFLDKIMMRNHIAEIRELVKEKMSGYTAIQLKASDKKRREYRESAKEIAGRIQELLG